MLEPRSLAPAPRRRGVALMFALASAGAALAPAAAEAHGGGELVTASRPPAPPGEGADAEKLLKEIEARAGRNPATARVVAAAIESAKKALERAQGARTAGDAAHARMLDGVALEWAETARDLERAAAAEDVALTTAKGAAEAATQVDRARALLEETQARRQRAAAELEKAEAEAKEAVKAAAAAEEARIEAAKKGGKAPKKVEPGKAEPGKGGGDGSGGGKGGGKKPGKKGAP